MEQFRILLADDEPIIRMDLRKTLENLGHVVVAEAGDGQGALDLAREIKPDIAILDIKMPQMDGIDVAKVISEEAIAPVLLLTAYSQKDLIDRAKEARVFAYLVKPFKETDLIPAIEVAVSRFKEFEALRDELGNVKSALEVRKLVDRAKGILMDKYSLKEHEAFRRIQLQSMNTRKPMKEIAEAIILAETV